MFCRRCGYQLPDNARFCPNCGCDSGTTNLTNVQNDQAQPEAKKEKFSKALIIVSCVFVAVIVLLILIVSLSDKNHSDPEPTNYQPYNDTFTETNSSTYPYESYTQADAVTDYSPGATVPAPERPATKSSRDLYSSVIKDYGKERVKRSAELENYDIEIPTYEYAIKDINSDGVDELVINEVFDDDGIYYEEIGAIYTLDGNKPVELYFMGRHGGYSISADGYFVYFYKENITIEKLVGTELFFVAENEEKLDDENYEKFFRDNGVSTDDMKFDFIPYNG